MRKKMKKSTFCTNFMAEKLLTLVLYTTEREGERCILLGHKNRGFGAGKFNGFGGKVSGQMARRLASSSALLSSEPAGVLTGGSWRKHLGWRLARNARGVRPDAAGRRAARYPSIRHASRFAILLFVAFTNDDILSSGFNVKMGTSSKFMSSTPRPCKVSYLVPSNNCLTQLPHPSVPSLSLPPVPPSFSSFPRVGQATWCHPRK